jgi:hypothetical protein
MSIEAIGQPTYPDWPVALLPFHRRDSLDMADRTRRSRS